jgi:Fur family ferric uptake transcriptional regulator
VEEFVDDGIEERQKVIAEQHGFEIHDHSMILYGHCRRADCPSGSPSTGKKSLHA